MKSYSEAMNLDALEAFAVFSETLNFTHAAKRLFISQPALHVKIKKLAGQLGVPLYVNDGKQLSLTSYGQQVARFAREMQDRVAAFHEELTGNAVERTVALAAGSGCYLYLLDKAISQYRKKSKSTLRLFTCGSEKTVELVRTGQAQLGVTVLTKPPVGLHAKKMASVRAMLIVPDHSEFAKRKGIGITSLKNVELIVPPEGRPHRLTIEKIFRAAEVPWRIAMEADGWELAIQFVRLGMGLAIVNGCCRLPRGVLGIPIRDFPGTDYFVLTRKKPKLNKEESLLYELIVKADTRS